MKYRKLILLSSPDYPAGEGYLKKLELSRGIDLVHHHHILHF